MQWCNRRLSWDVQWPGGEAGAVWRRAWDTVDVCTRRERGHSEHHTAAPGAAGETESLLNLTVRTLESWTLSPWQQAPFPHLRVRFRAKPSCADDHKLMSDRAALTWIWTAWHSCTRSVKEVKQHEDNADLRLTYFKRDAQLSGQSRFSHCF